MSLDYDAARSLLNRLFSEAEAGLNQSDPLPDAVQQAGAQVFASSTQSFREVLLGCALARLLDAGVDVTLPYVGHGAGAFNGRTLDERVVNPVLKALRMPSSKGPYLAAFRRSVRLDASTAKGLRDKKSYRAMLVYLDALKQADDDAAQRLTAHLCAQFILLRNASRIPLVLVMRITLEQLQAMIGTLMASPSGGRWPVFLTAAMFETLRDRFDLPWEIAIQGINEADVATGAGGDIVIRHRDTAETVLAVEVTLREIDGSRVVATFHSKIAVNPISDYLFLHAATIPTEDARAAALSYFPQGRDIVFLHIEAWLSACLVTVGAAGRAYFVSALLRRLDEADVPATMKLDWNASAEALTAPRYT